MGARTTVISLAIEPRTTADQEKLDHALQKLMGEDATLRVETDQQTGRTIIAGTGELQLGAIVDRLKREFGVDAALGKPQVAYKEKLTCAADGDGRYVRQTGGRGQYGHAKIHVYPGEPGTGYVFANEIMGGAIPDQFIQPVEDGIRVALAHGVLAGYPVDDVRVELYDGSYHEVDSSAIAFKIAGAMAFQDAAKKAKPVLLEPVMRVEVVIPEDCVDDVVRDLIHRRGDIQSQQQRGNGHACSARVPLSELFGYASDLQSRTHGLGTCSILFDRYEEVISPPPDDDVAVRQPRDRGPRGAGSAALASELEPERQTRAVGRNTLPWPSGSDGG